MLIVVSYFNSKTLISASVKVWKSKQVGESAFHKAVPHSLALSDRSEDQGTLHCTERSARSGFPCIWFRCRRELSHKVFLGIRGS